MQKAVMVVPCFNEAARLPVEDFKDFLARDNLALLFVDDGSTDGTPEVLSRLCEKFDGRASVLRLEPNGGKAEAVRRGMLQALESGAGITGFFDADLATPPAEIMRLLDLVVNGTKEVALASRVRLLGVDIERKALRHYLGRVFATCASFSLGIPVYDTQCGAKAFRNTKALATALEEPFVSRWAFDVELLGRLLIGAPNIPGASLDAFVEMPLKRWQDIAGSKVRFTDFPRMALDLFRIWRHLRRRRKENEKRKTGHAL